MTTALTMIVILLVSVMIHELAHYLNARQVGVPVRAFSVGMGPVIWRKNWRGTEWRFSLLPLGGYVDLPGMAPKVAEDGTLEHPDEGLARASVWQKIWVLIGGVIANFVLGVLLMAVVITVEPTYRGLTANLPTATVIGTVSPGSVAAELGLLDGDTITEINGVSNPGPETVVQIVNGSSGEVAAAGGVLHLTVQQPDGASRSYSLDWPPAFGEPLLGIALGETPVGADPIGLPAALAESLRFGFTAVPDMVGGFFRGFGSVLAGRQSEDITGPVGIVTAVNQATQLGFVHVLYLASVINLSLAVFNLLPIPGLDGGRILLALVTAVRGKRFKPGQEETIHFLGMMAVLLLIVLITVGDVGRLFGS